MYLGSCTRVRCTRIYMYTVHVYKRDMTQHTSDSCRRFVSNFNGGTAASQWPPEPTLRWRQSCEEARRRKKGRHPSKPGGLRRDGNHSGVEPLSPIWLMDRFMSPGIYTDLSAPARRARSFKASLNWRTRQRGHDAHVYAATDVSMQRAHRGWNFPSSRFWIAWESVLCYEISRN
jgi:hypothetical protein